MRQKKTAICSYKCRKKQQQTKRILKKKNKDIDYEKTFRNENMYWYNRVKKAKEKCPDEEIVKSIMDRYERHKKETLKKKDDVKAGRLSYREFVNWCFNERDAIDGLMKACGLERYS